MNKKYKLLTISLLGILLLVPFIKVSGAQSTSQIPTIHGVTVGQHEEWDANIFSTAWSQWNADNMTNRWGEAFGHTYLDNMSAVLGTAAKVPLLPQATMFYTIDEIIPDTNGFDENSDGGITADETWADPGVTLLNMTGGTFMDFGGWPYYYYFANGAGTFLANTTLKWAEHLGYGAMYTSLIWATNMFNSGNIGYFPANLSLDANMSNTIFFAPTNINWSEFADVCNTMLAGPVNSATGYTIKFENVTDGFMMSAAVGDFVQNTENINVTTTYDSNGLMTYHEFLYGTDVLVDMYLADSTYPVLTDSPSDFAVTEGYTGVTVSWTVTDENPGEYAILLDGDAEVFPTSWTSGVAIQFAVPDGLAPGIHTITLNIGDTRPNRPNVVTHEITLLVKPVYSPGIPGYNLVFVLGLLGITTAAIIVLMRKKKLK